MPQLTDEQRRAAESIEMNVLVSAGAGSGKTMVLVERYLEVLRNHPQSGVSDIVAVTFTRKAAEEMRSRLKARLKEICSTAEAPDERTRWNKLLADVDRARIGTIHSLCESLLKAFPAEAEVDPQFEIMDDLTRARTIHDCVENSLQSLISEADSDVLALLEYPIESIRKWMLSTMEQIPQYKESRRLFGDTSELLQEQAHKVICAVRTNAIQELLANKSLKTCLQFMIDNPWPDRDNKLEIARSETAGCLHELCALTLETEVAFDRAAELIAEIAAIASPGSAGGPKGKPLRDVLAEVRNLTRGFMDRCPLMLNEADAQAFAVLRALIRVLDSAIAAYEQRKVELQRLDYNDLIVKTHALVCQSGTSARKQFGERLRAVLVDEFQDTNHVQAQLLSSICGDSTRLFLIGDDKQSIYRFQGADVSTFNRWKSHIREGSHGLQGDGMLLDLSFSFRSHPSIVDFVNRFFRFYFHSDEGGAQAPHRAQHRPLVPSRTDTHEPQRVEVIVYDTSDGEQKRSSARARAVESQAISAWILEKIGGQCTIYDKSLAQMRPMSFGDFAVLVQANSDFASIESALADADIPYVTYAGSGFLNRQEILDMENMLRWLACPEDDHALIGILRSPFFGLNDGLIHKLYSEGQSTLWLSLQRSIKSDEHANMRSVVDMLKELLAAADQKSVSELIRTVIAITAYDVVCLSLPNGKQKSRNIWKFISFLRDYDALPISEFLAALQSMRDLGVTKQTDAPLSAEDSVKLMTIHKSKGLEFPAVALPVLSKKVHLFTPKLLMHRDFALAFDTSRSPDDQKPSFFRACLSIANELEEEERKRLLYVAMTRARDHLCFFIERSARNETSFRLWVKDALDIDTDETEPVHPSCRANINVGEHYQRRYFDDVGISEWEMAGRALAVNFIHSHDMEALAQEMAFDLLEPLSWQQCGEVPPKRIHWHRAERITLASRDKSLHPTVVGNLFHATMQHILNANTIADRQLIARLATAGAIGAIESSLRDALVERVVKLVSVYETSTLKELVATAARLLSEVNYTAVSLQAEADKRPDLILQDLRGQWKIIDFKTDQMSTQDIPSKVNGHSAQLMHYVRDFEAITGYKATGWLYFAELGRMEEVQPQSYAVGKKGQLRLFGT